MTGGMIYFIGAGIKDKRRKGGQGVSWMWRCGGCMTRWLLCNTSALSPTVLPNTSNCIAKHIRSGLRGLACRSILAWVPHTLSARVRMLFSAHVWRPSCGWWASSACTCWQAWCVSCEQLASSDCCSSGDGREEDALMCHLEAASRLSLLWPAALQQRVP